MPFNPEHHAEWNDAKRELDDAKALIGADAAKASRDPDPYWDAAVVTARFNLEGLEDSERAAYKKAFG